MERCVKEITKAGEPALHSNRQDSVHELVHFRALILECLLFWFSSFHEFYFFFSYSLSKTVRIYRPKRLHLKTSMFNEYSGSRVPYPSGGPRVALFSTGPGWDLKCKILTLENFLRHLFKQI